MKKHWIKSTSFFTSVIMAVCSSTLGVCASDNIYVKTATESVLSSMSDYPENHVQQINLSDKNTEAIVSGDRNFAFSNVEAGIYGFSYKYCTDFGSDVNLYFNGSEYATLSGGKGVDEEDFSSSSLMEAAGIIEIDGNFEVDALCSESTNNDTLYSHSFSLKPALDTIEVSEITEEGVYPVEIIYKAKNSESKERKIEFFGGNEIFPVHFPKLTGEEESVIFDMKLSPLNCSIVNFDSNIEIQSAQIYTGNVRRFEAEELSPDAIYRADQSKDGSTFTTMGALPADVQMFKTNTGETVNIGHVLTYYAPTSGNYNIRIRYYGVASTYSVPFIYVNNVSNRNITATADGVTEYSVNVELTQGENKIYVLRGAWVSNGYYPTNQANIYTDYIEITAPKIDIRTLNVDESGVYPVLVEYIGEDGSSGPITLSDADNIYAINYPKYTGNAESYVLDIPLIAGENKLTVGADNVEVTNVSLYTETERLYEGEELASDKAQLTKVDSTGNAKTFAMLGNLATGITASDGKEVTLGAEILYKAPLAGKYTITMQYYGVQWSYIVPRVRLVSDELKELVYTGEASDNRVIKVSFDVELQEGTNKIWITQGQWSGSSFVDVSLNKMYLDYVNIVPSLN